MAKWNQVRRLLISGAPFVEVNDGVASNDGDTFRCGVFEHKVPGAEQSSKARDGRLALPRLIRGIHGPLASSSSSHSRTPHARRRPRAIIVCVGSSSHVAHAKCIPSAPWRRATAVEDVISGASFRVPCVQSSLTIRPEFALWHWQASLVPETRWHPRPRCWTRPTLPADKHDLRASSQPLPAVRGMDPDLPARLCRSGATAMRSPRP